MDIIKFVPMINILNCFLPKATEIHLSIGYLASVFGEYGCHQFRPVNDAIRKNHLGGKWYNKIAITTIAVNHLNFSISIFFPLNNIFCLMIRNSQNLKSSKLIKGIEKEFSYKL